MNLRGKTLVTVGASLVCLIIILYSTAQMEIANSFSNLEERDTQKNVDRVLNTISNELVNLGNLADYWAARNDTHSFMKTGDSNFIDFNMANGLLTNESLHNMDINLILFMDSYGQIILSKYLDVDGEGKIIPQNITQELSLYAVCPGCLTKENKFSGLILLSDKPMLVVAKPIINGLGTPSMGRVVLGRYLAEKEVQKISEVTQLNLTLYSLNNDQMPADVRQARTSLDYSTPIIVRTLNSDNIAGYALLRNIYGNPLLILRVDVPRAIYRQGISSMQSFIILFSAAGALFLILTLVYLDRSVLSRLSSLTAGVNIIGVSQNISSRLRVEGKDELTHLASSINIMLKNLEQSHEDLGKSEKRYKAVVEEQPDLICRILVDGTITFVNDAFCRFFFKQPDELIGKKIDMIASAGQMKSAEELKSKLKTGHPTESYESRITLPNGTHWLIWTAHGIFDESGFLMEIQSVGRDFTDLKMAEAALRDSQQLMSNIISFLPDAIMAIDLDGKVIIWNKAMEALTGVDAEDMLGKGEYEYSLPFYGFRRPILIDMVLNPHKDFEIEYANFKREATAVLGETFIPNFGKNGSYLLAKATTLFDPAGRLVGAIESVRDMTERRLMEQTLEKTRTELHIAAEIQKSFIPEKTPFIQNLEIAAKSIPAMEVGGDFYDFIPLPEGKYGLVIADVAGKGIPAALFMALSRTIIRANASHQTKTSEVLKNANHMIAADATAGMFVTLLYGILDGEALTFNYADAGHPPPLLFRSKTFRFEAGGVTGIALGAKDGVEYEDRTIMFSPGDIAIFYTDGVTEAMNVKGELYGLSRLTDIVSEYHELSPEKLVDKVLNDISNFSSGCEPNDDITLIVLKAFKNTVENFEIKISAKKEEIPKVISFVNDIMGCGGFSRKDVLDLELAVEEATINIINHGYHGAEGIILVKCKLEVDRLTVVIEDEANRFDPIKYDKPNLVENLDKRPIGGLGIYLIRSLTDDSRYEYEDGKNRLILLKRKSLGPHMEQRIDQKGLEIAER